MKQSFLSLLGALGLAFITFSALAQDDKPTSSFTVKLNKDNFFGFYPSIGGTYGLKDKMELSFYGTFWTTPSFSFNSGGGGLWTEFGAGLRFLAMDKKIAINPQVGILHGNLLSGSPVPVFLDGVVPNLTVNLMADKWEGEFYGGYYLAANRRPRTVMTSYLHYWLNAGYKVSSFMSLGLHGEVLGVAGGTDRTGTTERDISAVNVYEWVGGYVQFSLPSNGFLRLTGGRNLLPAGLGNASYTDFYKMSGGISF
ncbi:MAG: hypothetical protein MUC97_12255 [Bernardetiaceae bacterium]|jgi:hypothetical protein|nr:hypothetical protein [Bernardetiaceae bacterium]